MLCLVLPYMLGTPPFCCVCHSAGSNDTAEHIAGTDLEKLVTPFTSFNATLKPAADAASHITGMMKLTEIVLEPKRSGLEGLIELMEFVMDLFQSAMSIVEDVLNAVFQLPVIKQIVDFISKAEEKILELVNWILEATGVQAFLDTVLDQCNPFKAFGDKYLDSMKELANLDFFDDLSSSMGKALAEFDDLHGMVKIDAYGCPSLSAGGGAAITFYNVEDGLELAQINSLFTAMDIDGSDDITRQEMTTFMAQVSSISVSEVNRGLGEFFPRGVGAFSTRTDVLMSMPMAFLVFGTTPLTVL